MELCFLAPVTPQTDRKSIGVFGAGSGLGQAVAHRYARAGYGVVLVARRREPLQRLADDLAGGGATAHIVTADLSDTAAIAGLAEQIRAAVGDLDVIYYGPTPADGFVPAQALTPQRLNAYLPLAVHSLVALVQEFLPAMLDRGDGAILTGQGASAMRGLPHLSGPGPAQAAQRNYLQSLGAEVAGRGVYVGQLFIGAAIENTPFHAEREAAKAAGEQVWEMPTADPDHLAELLATMHATRSVTEATYPERLFAS
jgi:short-subunit dehydrogenase